MKHISAIFLLILLATTNHLGCQDSSSSSISAGGGSVSGMSRWTPYGSEQGAYGTCKNFYDYSSDSKQWAAVSEKFAKEHLGFSGCTDRGPNQSPGCQGPAFESGICGKQIQVRCTSAECVNNSWHTVYIVDICPADRRYHDIADPDSRGDYACRDLNVVDLDESLWYQVWKPGARWVNNVSIEISFDGRPSAQPPVIGGGQQGAYPTCQSAASDPDGDGWGWENQRSCKVRAGSGGQQGAYPTCRSAASDPDGDGWGWENQRSCKVR